MCVSHIAYKKFVFHSLVLFSNLYLVPFSRLFLHDTLVVTPRDDNKPDSSKNTWDTHTHTTLQRRGKQMHLWWASVGERKFYKTDQNQIFRPLGNILKWSSSALRAKKKKVLDALLSNQTNFKLCNCVIMIIKQISHKYKLPRPVLLLQDYCRL